MSHGFRLPFEGDPHAATWASYPFEAEQWAGFLEPARDEYCAFIRELAAREPVHLLLGDEEAAADVRRRGLPVTAHPAPLNDCWYRDNGPLFLKRGEQVALQHWGFNAWGEKYGYERDRRAAEVTAKFLGVRALTVPYILEGGSIEVDGQGTALTTRQCLLHPRRNPGLDEAAVEKILGEHLGIERLIWLDQGLEGDHTDGHIDTLARFTAPGRVVCCAAEPGDSNHAVLRQNREILARHFQVTDLPIPQEKRYLEGVRLAESYANFYLAREAVLVPIYGDPQDEPALAILRREFPGRQVVGLMARAIATGGGAFHCLTQPQPEGTLCDWP